MSDLKDLSETELADKLDVNLNGQNYIKDKSELQQVAHELQTHQIELEMQNRELREMQVALEESRNRYADLYDFAPVGYLSLDERGVIHEINLVGATMLGQLRANIIGQPLLQWIAKSDSNVFFQHLLTTFKSDKKISSEFKIKSANGQLIDARIESVRSKGEIDNRLYCRTVILDVTEFNRIRNDAILHARQLKLITDSLPVSIAYINKNERHLFANKTYTDWFNVLPEEILGKHAKEVWGEINYQYIRKYLQVALGGDQVSYEMELPLGEKNSKVINATFIPDCDDYDQVYGIIALMHDITDRLSAEAVDRKHMLDVAHTTRLTSMGEMASEIAHELNQPLAVISIYSDACRRMILSGNERQDKIIKSLGDISEQAERAGDVIRRIRTFASKKEFQKRKTDINEVVQEAVRLLTVEFHSHKVKLELKMAGNLPKIMADKLLIEQVIFNLARNALEAMDDISESHRLLCIQTSTDRLNEIEVDIADSGPGLSAEQTNQLFVPFHTTKEDGMGLGLSICQSIIAAHNGRLWAVQNKYGGSTFCFTLPIKT